MNMETIKKQNNITFYSSDDYSKFEFKLLYNCTWGSPFQLQIDRPSEYEDIYIDLDLKELKEIQKIINEVIELKEN